MIRTKLAAIAGIAGLSLVGAGCTAQPSAKPADPVVLTIGTDDEPGAPSADEIEEFARQVSKLSDGAITIEPKWHAAGDVKDWDQAVAKMVVDGDLDSDWSLRGRGRVRSDIDGGAHDPLSHSERRTGREALSGDVAADLISFPVPDTGVVGVGCSPRGFAIRLASTRRWGVRELRGWRRARGDIEREFRHVCGARRHHDG